MPHLRFDTQLSALTAAKAELGVALASLPLCARALEEGTLVRLDDRSLAHHESYWLLAGPKAVSRQTWATIAESVWQ